jgi:hypothetical protein
VKNRLVRKNYPHFSHMLLKLLVNMMDRVRLNFGSKVFITQRIYNVPQIKAKNFAILHLKIGGKILIDNSTEEDNFK